MNLPISCYGCLFYDRMNDITFCRKGKRDKDAKTCNEYIINTEI